MSNKISVNFFDNDSGSMILSRSMLAVPRNGDRVYFSEIGYAEVVTVLWRLDVSSELQELVDIYILCMR